MNLSITELKNRLRTVQDRFELLRLREDITAFMASPQFQQLSQSGKNRVEDLLVEAIAKEEQYKGCDPWITTLGCSSPHGAMLRLKSRNRMASR